jgi:hypothetical protein
MQPPREALNRIFYPVDLDPDPWREDEASLLPVGTVTRLVIRRQLRHELYFESINYLLQRMPRLKELVWEPWADIDHMSSMPTDPLYWQRISTSSLFPPIHPGSHDEHTLTLGPR